MIDDRTATGFLANWAAKHEYREVMGKITSSTGTLGKPPVREAADFTVAQRRLSDLLRQRCARIYFPNNVAPDVPQFLKALELLTKSASLVTS